MPVPLVMIIAERVEPALASNNLAMEMGPSVVPDRVFPSGSVMVKVAVLIPDSHPSTA
jgi:hypothetical protein